MRTAALAFLMLLVFWGTGTWLASFGVHWQWRDVQFALALQLFFGTILAVPAIIYLLCADAFSNRFIFPRSVLAYLLFVAFGCILLAVLKHYWKGDPLPTTSEGWYYYWRAYIPPLAMASLPLLRRIFRMSLSQGTHSA